MATAQERHPVVEAHAKLSGLRDDLDKVVKELERVFPILIANAPAIAKDTEEAAEAAGEIASAV